MKIDLEELRKRSEYINEIKHPLLDLILWNYTNHCQFDGAWDEYTMMARGLITDLEGNILARPFKKFFNLNSTPETMIEKLPTETPEVFEKLDGSLGIQYTIHGIPHIATRGSFNSDQAKWATEWIRDNSEYSTFMDGYTYLYEIIYPENRIVVDYGKREELVLLAVVNNDTGEEVDIVEEARRLNLSHAKRIPHALAELVKGLSTLSGNEEGYVVKYSNGFRVKMKGEEYVRLHRLITGFSSKSIWECLMNGQNLNEMIERVPDEFYTWVKKTEAELQDAFNRKYAEAYNVYEQVKDMPDRKSQALWLQENSPESLSFVFGILDKREISKQIWKGLKPTYELPFKQDMDL